MSNKVFNNLARPKVIDIFSTLVFIVCPIWVLKQSCRIFDAEMCYMSSVLLVSAIVKIKKVKRYNWANFPFVTER